MPSCIAPRQAPIPSLRAFTHPSAQTHTSAVVLDIFDVSPFLQQPTPSLPHLSDSFRVVFQERSRNAPIPLVSPSSLPPPMILDGPSRPHSRYLSLSAHRPKTTASLHTPPPRIRTVVVASHLPIEIFDGPAKRVTRTGISLPAILLVCAAVAEGCILIRNHRDIVTGTRQRNYDEFFRS